MRAGDARIVLTGASGGLGRAFAAALVDAGASVMLVGRSPARLSEQARQLSRRAGDAEDRVRWHAADLDRRVDAERLSAAAVDWKANVLVLGAGVPSFGRFDGLEADAVAATLRTNLVSPILLTQLMLPHLRQQPRAQIICIGSALGSIGLPGFSVYSAGKFGLHGFAESLRRELADTPVRVQYLGPRSTRTSFNNAAVERYNAATGTAMDEPNVVAAALLRLLAEERAERFVGFPERLAVRLNAIVPAWLDGSFAKHRRSVPDALLESGAPRSGRDSGAISSS
jgi:short-subunit dehydrogenase